MPPILIQSKQGSAGTSIVNVTTLNLTFTSPTVAGNLIIASFQVGSATSTSTSFSDDKSNSYAGAGSDILPEAGYQDTVALAYVVNAHGGTQTITLTSTTAGVLSGAIYEFANLIAADGTASQQTTYFSLSGNQPTPDPGSITTTADGDLIFATGMNAGGSGAALNIQSGFTAGKSGLNGYNNDAWADQWMIQTTAGAIDPHFVTPNIGSSFFQGSAAVALKSLGGVFGGFSPRWVSI